jgi:hypothetical protein
MKANEQEILQALIVKQLAELRWSISFHLPKNLEKDSDPIISIFDVLDLLDDIIENMAVGYDLEIED